jgi:hypothetical protein
MKKSDASQGQSASGVISKRIAETRDWRGETLSRMRKLIKKADPDVVEEVREPATSHRLTVPQIHRWCDGFAVSPDETLKKRRLKQLLA